MKKKIFAVCAATLLVCGLFTASACSQQEPTLDQSGTQTETPETGNGQENSSGNENVGAGNDNGSATPPAIQSPVPETPPKPTTQQYLKCVGDNVNLRSGAGTSYTVLGQAEEGTMYAIIGKTGNWYKTYYRGKTAYIYAEYASVFTLLLSESSTTEKVLSEAYKHIGVPYVYGAVRLHDGKGNLLKGFTAQKFDCSSLVQYVYYKGGGQAARRHHSHAGEAREIHSPQPASTGRLYLFYKRKPSAPYGRRTGWSRSNLSWKQLYPAHGKRLRAH